MEHPERCGAAHGLRIDRGDREILPLRDQIVDLREERFVICKLEPACAVGDMPGVDLRLQFLPPGQQRAVLRPEIMDDCREAAPEIFRIKTGAGDCLSLDWRVPEHQPTTLALPSSILPLLTGPDRLSGDQSTEATDETPPTEARDITGDEPKEVGKIADIAAESEALPASSGPSSEASAEDGPVRTVDLKEPPKTQTAAGEKPAGTDDKSAPVPQLSQRPDDPGPRNNGNGGGVPRY